MKPPPFPLKWKLHEGTDFHLPSSQGPEHLLIVGTREVSDEQRLEFHGPLKISGEGGGGADQGSGHPSQTPC